MFFKIKNNSWIGEVKTEDSFETTKTALWVAYILKNELEKIGKPICLVTEQDLAQGEALLEWNKKTNWMLNVPNYIVKNGQDAIMNYFIELSSTNKSEKKLWAAATDLFYINIR